MRLYWDVRANTFPGNWPIAVTVYEKVGSGADCLTSPPLICLMIIMFISYFSYLLALFFHEVIFVCKLVYWNLYFSYLNFINWREFIHEVLNFSHCHFSTCQVFSRRCVFPYGMGDSFSFFFRMAFGSFEMVWCFCSALMWKFHMRVPWSFTLTSEFVITCLDSTTGALSFIFAITYFF